MHVRVLVRVTLNTNDAYHLDRPCDHRTAPPHLRTWRVPGAASDTELAHQLQKTGSLEVLESDKQVFPRLSLVFDRHLMESPRLLPTRLLMTAGNHSRG